MKEIEKILKKIFETRLLKHSIFSVLFLILFSLPAVLTEGFVPNFYRIPLYGIFLLVCIYMGRMSADKWLLKQKYSKFIFFSLILIITLITAGVTGSDIFTNSHSLRVTTKVSLFVLIFYSTGLFISFARNTISIQLKEKDIERRHKESELQFLRSQLNPHFIFNILNNLYGISLKTPEKLPGLLLKLSNILRYTVYSAKENFVSLQEEIEYIENYIELEKTRFGERLLLTKNIQRDNIEHIRIPPLLLIVFVENAFKHSRETVNNKILIQIDLQILGNVLSYAVKNSLGENINTKRNIKNSGIGVSTTLKRLELLYPNKYHFDKYTGNNLYQIILEIELSHEAD